MLNMGLDVIVYSFVLIHASISALGEKVPVTCGSTIKLAHSASKARLHSHEVAYSRGSQQQSVTGFPSSDDSQSYWVVHGTKEDPCIPGGTFKKGSALRLQHTVTRKWLHSHQFHSPMTQNQEVSAYGSDSESDGGDVWVLDWESKAKIWKQDGKVRLKHRDTGVYLYSSDGSKFGHPINGQQEICGVRHKDKNSEWQTAEGIFLPTLEATIGGEGQATDSTNDEL